MKASRNLRTPIRRLRPGSWTVSKTPAITRSVRFTLTSNTDILTIFRQESQPTRPSATIASVHELGSWKMWTLKICPKKTRPDA